MKLIKKIIIIVVLAVIIVVSIFAFLGYQQFSEVLAETPLEEKVASIEKKKTYEYMDKIPKIYFDAVVSVEDHRFFDRGAIDIIAIGRAIFTNIKEKELVQGGSTITQQLAKNLYFTQNKDFVRKIAETFMSIELEKNYSKNKILELYVNTSYFGDGYYGIKEACNGYYNIEPADMNLYEATLLAGVPNAPSIYAPTNSLKLAEQRQKYVVSAMLEYGKITREQANEVLNAQQTK